MAVVRLKVQIDKEECVFSCGEQVTGCVSIELTEDVQTMGVELLVYGGSRILLHSEKERQPREPLTEEEIYVRDTYSLWGNPSSEESDTETLETGRHYFPFSFMLPDDTPCSYEGADCWVRYYMQGRLFTSASAQNVVARKYMTVLKDLDLSTESTKSVVMEEKENVPHVMCCHPGRLSCSIQLPNSAFVPGESVKASVRISNTSMLRLKGVSVLLQQVVKTCPSENKSHQVANNIAQSIKMAVPPGYKGNTRALAVTIPPCPPTSLQACSLIDIQYYITLSIPLSPVAMNISIPVVIGSIPCVEGTSYSYTMKLQAEENIKLSRPNEWTLSPSSYQLSANMDNNAVYRPMYKTYTLENQDELSLQELTCSPKCLQKSSIQQEKYMIGGRDMDNVESMV